MIVQQSSISVVAPRFFWWTIATGIAFAVAALVVAPLAGLEISDAFDRRDGQVTWATLFVGVFLTGCFFTWLLMSRPRRFSHPFGAVTGVLVAFFSYPVVILLVELLQRGWNGGMGIAEYAKLGTDLLFQTSLALLTTGFAATLIFAAVGAVMAWAAGRLDRRAVASEAANIRRRGFWRGLLAAAGILAVLILAFLIGGFAMLSLLPLDVGDLGGNHSTAAPASTYDEAIAQYRQVEAREAKLPLNPRCRSTLLSHGAKTERVVIYFHGLTSCPAQADVLAQQLFATGANVYIPRIPGHGEADPLTLALADLTAEDMVGVANEATDLAQGLGNQVVVIGLSAGGTIATWIAQYRPDVAQTIAVAPFLGPHVVPPWANHAATNLLRMLPNMMIWWNPIERGNPPELAYAYPRFATRGLAQVLRLGAAVIAGSEAAPPAATHLGMMLNDADFAVSNPLAEEVAQSWRDHGRQVTVEILPASRRLPHDIIDPRQPGGDTDSVYALLIRMIGAAAP